jgi:hypothetical protein
MYDKDGKCILPLGRYRKSTGRSKYNPDIEDEKHAEERRG